MDSARLNSTATGFPITLSNAETVRGLQTLRIAWSSVCIAACVGFDILIIAENLKKITSTNVLFGLIIPWLITYFIAFRSFRFNRPATSITLDANGIHISSPGVNSLYPWPDIDRVTLNLKKTVGGKGAIITTKFLKIIRNGAFDYDDQTGIIIDEYSIPIEEIKSFIDRGVMLWGSTK